MHWAVHVFTFLLAVTKVNLRLIMQYFVWKRYKESFYHSWIHTEISIWNWLFTPLKVADRMGVAHSEHRQWSAPMHAKCFRRRQWDHSNKQPYQQYKCRTSGYNKTIWSYFTCSDGSGCAWTVMACTWGGVAKQFKEVGSKLIILKIAFSCYINVIFFPLQTLPPMVNLHHWNPC